MMGSARLFLYRVVALGVLCCFLQGCVWEHETLLYVRDEVCQPGETVRLVAKLEENDWRWEDVEGKPISFWRVTADGKFEPLGGVVTDGQAQGSVVFRPPAPGEYFIECQFAGARRLRPSSFRAFVLCRRPERYGIILDIDKTLAATTVKDVFAGHLRLAPPLDSDTVRVVNALAREYELFIVTSRPRTQAPTVLEWLARNGFPRVPTFFYDPRGGALRPKEAKRVIFQHLKKVYPLVAVGIGDRESDLEGYMRNGILAVGIGHREKGAFCLRSWAEVEKVLLSSPDPGLIPSELIVFRGKDRTTFWPMGKDRKWSLDYSLKVGDFASEAPAEWPVQFRKILKLITTTQRPHGAD